MNLENLDLVELTAQEVEVVNGGDEGDKKPWWFTGITGVLDGIPGNTEGWFFGWHLWG